MEDKEKREELKKIMRKKIDEEIRSELRQELLDEIYSDLLREEQNIEKNGAIIKKSSQKPVNKILEKKVINSEEEQTSQEEVFISVKAILKVASHALKYANKKIPKKEWVEVIGLLAGNYDESKDILYIEDAYPIGHGNAIHVEMNFERNKKSGHGKAYKEIRKKKLFVCGWYHSHPTYGCFMSPEDKGTQANYQTFWPRSVALVIDPYKIDGSSAGFEIYRLDLKTDIFYPLIYGIKGSLDIKMLPEILEFINPIIEGKALYLEYDED